MQLTKKQSFYLSLIHSAEHNKLSIREVAEQNNVNAVNLYAAIKTLREKGALPAVKEQRNFVKLSAPSLTHDLHIELKTQLPNGQVLWLNITEAQLPVVLRALGA
jgi:predicted DNA-binding protein YlxM (UPF0122 family)